MLIVLLSVGCSNDMIDTLTDEDSLSTLPISFNTKMPKTRSQLLNEFPDGGSFGVIGYCKVNGQSGTSPWDVKKVQATPDVFYNQKITYHMGTGCTYDNTQYWSENSQDKYTFFAYYPYNITSTEGGGSPISLTAKTKMGPPVITYTMPYTSTKATKALNASKMIDVMFAFAKDRTEKMGGIVFDFYHLLTNIQFSVNNYNTKDTIFISSIQLQGTFAKKVALDIDAPQLIISDTYAGTFTVLDTQQGFIPNATSGAEAIETEHDLMLIPQSFQDQSDWTILITYRKGVNGKQLNKSYEVKNAVFPSGEKYTFYLDFVGDICTLRGIPENYWDDAPIVNTTFE